MPPIRSTLAALASCAALLTVPAAAVAAPGDFDGTFAGGGFTTLPTPCTVNEYPSTNGFAQGPDGELYMTALMFCDSAPDPVVLFKRTPDGAVDTTFGGGDGQIQVNDTASKAHVAVQDDGRILVAAQRATGQSFVARYLEDGTPDPDWGGAGDGLVAVPDDFSTEVAYQPGAGPFEPGRVLYLHDGGVLALREEDGQIDETFGVDGTDDNGWLNYSQSLLVDSERRILWGAGSDSLVTRRLPDGGPDPSFGTDGEASTPLRFSSGAMTVTPEGQVVVANSQERQKLQAARLREDGSPDPTFGTTGTTGLAALTVADGATLDRARLVPEVIVQPDGRVIVGAYWHTDSTSGWDMRWVFGRFLDTGLVDESFGDGADGSVIHTRGGSCNGRYWMGVGGLALDGDRLIVSGKTSTAGCPSDDVAVLAALDASYPLPRATVSVVNGVMRYSAPAGTENHLTIEQFEPGSHDLTELGDVVLLAGAGCDSVGDDQVSCEGVRRVDIEAGDRDDLVTNLESVPMTVHGGDGDDVLWGGTGDDLFDGGTGSDDVTGDAGVDTMAYAGRQEAVRVALDSTANDGAIDTDPEVAGNQGEADRVQLSVENVVGGSGADTLTGNAAANVLTGNGGNDLLDGRGGADTLAGGPDADTASYAAAAAPVAVTMDTSRNDGLIDADTAAAGNQTEGDLVRMDVETVVGGRAGDRLTGGAAAETLDGRGGDDILDGRAGGDTLVGGADLDTVSYVRQTAPLQVLIDGLRNDGIVDVDATAAGNQPEGDYVRTDVETVLGGSGPDKLTGGSLANVLDGRGGEDVLDGRAGADTLIGGTGLDTVTYALRSAGVQVLVDSVANDGTIDTDPVAPGNQSEGDLVRLDVENLTGGGGHDILSARAPNAVVNVLSGGLGDDRLNTRDGTGTVDRLVCGGGTDTAVRDVSDQATACEAAG